MDNQKNYGLSLNYFLNLLFYFFIVLLQNYLIISFYKDLLNIVYLALIIIHLTIFDDYYFEIKN